MTGVRFPMHQFLNAASEKIPTCIGIKYSEPDFMTIQQCLHLTQKKFKIYFGCDEALLPSLDLGIHGAIGSTYNFLGPVFRSLLSAKQKGDSKKAAEEQYKVVEMVACLNEFGYLPAAKQLMSWIGCPCGPIRSPLKGLDAKNQEKLRALLEEKLGFFQWIDPMSFV